MHLDLNMGKYAVFVWTSYGATLFGLGALAFISVRVHARRKAILKALQDAANIT